MILGNGTDGLANFGRIDQIVQGHQHQHSRNNNDYRFD